MSTRRWNDFTQSYKPRDVAEGSYFDTEAGRFMAVRYKYKRTWAAQHMTRELRKSFSVSTKEEAKRLCDEWANGFGQ